MMPCTGALLCGGASSRMGRDKSFLTVDGLPLWRMQVKKLARVCSEVLVCGKASQRSAMDDRVVRFECDSVGGRGPLSGIVQALECSSFGYVLVLAVDMPRMNEVFMSRLLDLTGEGCGVVPFTERGFEGLCAVYPAAILPIARVLLDGPTHSLQGLVSLGVERRLLRPTRVLAPDRKLFVNWNFPSDVRTLPEEVSGTD